MRLLSLTVFFLSIKICVVAQQVHLVIPKGHTAAVSDATIFGNNRYVITGGRDNSVKIWDIKEKKEINSLVGEKGRDAFSFVGVSSDEKYFFRGGSKEVSMWEMATQKQIFNIKDGKGFFKDFFSVPNENVIYYRSSVGIKNWEIYKLSTTNLTPEKVYDTKEECKWQKVLYASDGSYLLYAPFDSYENTDIIKVYLPSGKKEKVLNNLKSVEGIAMVNKSKAVYWNSSGEYIFFNPDNGSEISRLNLKNFEDVRFSPSGEIFAAKENFKSEKISFFNTKTGEKLFANNISGHKKINDQSEQIISFKFSSDGQYLVSTGLDKQALIWNCTTGKPIYATNENIVETTKPTKALFSPTNNYIVADDVLHDILTNWNINKSAPAYQLKNFYCSGDALSFDIAADGKQLAAPGTLKNVNIYDAESGTLTDLNKDKATGVHFYNARQLALQIPGNKDEDKNFSLQSIGSLSNATPYASYSTLYTDYVAFNNVKGLMARANFESGIAVYNMNTGEQQQVETDDGLLQSLCYNAEGTFLYAAYTHKKKDVNYTIVYDAVSLKKVKRLNIAVKEICISKGDRLMAGVSYKNEFEIELYDIPSEQLVTTYKGHNSVVSYVSFSPDEKMLLSASNDHTTRLWSLSEKKERASLISFVNSDWAVVMPDGRFDASDQAQKRMYFAAGLKQIPLSNLYEKFYTPKLLARILAGEQFPELNVDINNIRQRPRAKIQYSEKKRNLEVEEDIPSYVNTSGVAQLVVNATAPDDKVDEIRLFHNGKVVTLATRGMFVADNEGVDSKTYSLSLLTGVNHFSAVALNSQRTESEPDEIRVLYNSNVVPAPAPVINNVTNTPVDGVDKNATLYMVVIGINAYTKKIKPLSYAVPDATAFKQEIEKDASSMISSVKAYSLTDAKAYKSDIVSTFNEIKKNARPQDVFVFYFAGHGYIHPATKQFYLVSADVEDGEESLLKNGISSSELQGYAIGIAAQKQVFILDACQSAGAFEQMLQHDGEQQKNIAVLARSTGTHWLAASGSSETAKEFATLGHGAFTYILLEALKGKAITNSMITVNGLKNYLQLNVPQLIKKYGGNSQYPASYGLGNDFPVEIVK